MSGDTASDRSFNRALEWLDECTSTHDICNTSSTDQQMPDRLVDVTSDVPKLIENHGLVERYVCLSHCWGNHQPLQTTTHTIEQHKIEIAWKAIPRTFQDAIKITKRLHVDYIWIDSLCIIQDDSKDWVAQAAQMGDIYSNAFLTIAATCAPNSTHGLFSKTPDMYLPETCYLTTPDGSLFPLQVREVSKFHVADFSGDHSILECKQIDLPLLSRAWVLQERLLSPRLLHFAAHELIWECRHMSKCECSSMNAAQQLPYHWPTNLEVFKDRLNFHLKRRFTGNAETAWHKVITAYTSLQLSFKKDIFTALSGIAHRENAKRSTRYLAGLWEDSLFRDLLWAVVPRRKRLDVWRAPTWSWASMEDAAVVFALPEGGEIHASLLKANIVPRGADEFGELESASLVLQGWMSKAYVGSSWTLKPYIKIPNTKWNMFPSQQVSLDSEMLQLPESPPVLKIASIYFPMDDRRRNPRHKVPYYTYYFLVLRSVEDEWSDIIGLASIDVCDDLEDDESSLPVFKRIGLASVDVYEPLEEDFWRTTCGSIVEEEHRRRPPHQVRPPRSRDFRPQGQARCFPARNPHIHRSVRLRIPRPQQLETQVQRGHQDTWLGTHTKLKLI